MDDQTQSPFDPSATQAPRRRKSPPPSQSGQPDSARGGPPPQAEKGDISQIQQQPTRLLPNSQPNSAKQLPRPQPILFSEVNIEVLAEGQMLLPRQQRFRRTRRWLRSRSGRIIVPLIALVVGLVVGLSSILWYGLSGTGPITIIRTSTQGNLIVEADKDLVTQLVRNNITKSGMPGQVQNVNVTLAHGDAMTVQGDDVYSVLVMNLSRHFTVNVQPYIQSCVLQVRVTQANLGGIPVTGFAQAFDGNINQQLAQKPSGLPGGFAYCAVSVRTEPGGMFLTYKAVPLGK
jgi:hypothetical protein